MATSEKWETCLSSHTDPHMFIGEYAHNLDEKGRLAVPKNFGATVKALLSPAGSTTVYFCTKKVGEARGKLANLPTAQANTRAFARLMLAGAMDARLTSRRIILPSTSGSLPASGKESLSPVSTTGSKSGTVQMDRV